MYMIEESSQEKFDQSDSEEEDGEFDENNE